MKVCNAVGKKGIVRGYAVCSLGLAKTYLIGPGCILAILRLRRPWLLLLLLLRLLLLLLLRLLLLRLLLLNLLLLLLLLLRRRRSLTSRRLLLRRRLLLLLLHGRVGSPLRRGRGLLITHDGRGGVGGGGDDGARRDGKKDVCARMVLRLFVQGHAGVTEFVLHERRKRGLRTGR